MLFVTWAARLLAPFASILIAIGVTVFLYEGLSIPLYFTEVHLFEGRVDRVRAKADARCEARIRQSIDDAVSRDAEVARQAMERAEEDARRANERALAAQAQNQEYEHEINQLAPALRNCRMPSDSDWRRLQ